MKALVVLSHLMSKDCDLEVESISRAELAIEKFSNKEYDINAFAQDPASIQKRTNYAELLAQDIFARDTMNKINAQ